MDATEKLMKHIELFEAEESLRKMEQARRQSIELWNRDIRAARKIVTAIRNEIRSGVIQPGIFDMVKT